MGDLLAQVVQADGVPVGAALFDGTGAFTDVNGVTTGLLAPNAAGWTRLSADGFVTQWVKPLPATFQGKKLVLATLTPVQVEADLAGLEAAIVVVGDPALPDAVVQVPMLGFLQPVTVSFTTMRAQDLGPMAFAPQSGGTTLKLERAFSIEATDEQAAVQPANPIDVQLRHPARFGAPTLGTFDPDAGEWVMDPAACARVDAEWVRCSLTHFSTNGLFGDPPPDSTGDAWGDALADQYGDGGGSIDDLANAALDYANRHPSEAGKSALMAAAAKATAAGRSDLVNTLVDRGRTLVEDLIDIELHEEGCGHVSEMMHLLQQAIALAVSDTQQEQLRKRIDEALNGCDVWVGWIHYSYRLGATMPEDEDLAFAEGSRQWTERHVVRISRDDKGNFHGESTADVSFPNVVYRNDEDDTPECGDDFVDMEAEGNPSTGRVRVLFEGVVADGAWTVTKVSSEPLAAMALRTRYHTHKWQETEGGCVLAVSIDERLPWTDSYTTQLHQGFLGPTPPSIAEMLTDGHQSPNPLGRGEPCVHGFETATVEAQPGVWPFTDVYVSWNFFQVTPAK